VTVRYFAAAAEAVGSTQEQYQCASLGALREAMTRRHGTAVDPVLARCAWLVDGAYADDPALPLRDGVTVDVLPPFAGG
jgi:molybdopterin converting factor small subunit